ncbi:flagellar protein [Vibrio algivorus]|uniref:Flagellar protein n=2 Tax=Vibrio algivorus TaxID=1667024 RepID=A0A557P2R2_9VIBR|nr:flagellar protein [Vibrio algivorus]
MTKMPSLNNDDQKDFYLDFNALNTLKYEKDSDKALIQVAEKFEALFVQEMFKRMRSATEALGNKDNPLSNNSNSMFQTMLDTQLATSMTKQTSFGLAEMLYQQLSNNHLSNNSQGAV